MACSLVGVVRDLFRAVRRGGRVRCGGALSGGSAARMVADDGGAAMNEAWRDLGTPEAGGVLLIGDHASAIVPADIDLGLDPVLLTQHIAFHIGVAVVAALRVDPGAADAAILCGGSSSEKRRGGHECGSSCRTRV